MITDPSNPKSEPFAFADFTWLTGNARTVDTPYATKFFTPEIRSDVNYTYDFRHPQGRHHQRIERDLPLQRSADNPVRSRRRLPLRQRARSPDDTVRPLLRDHSAQRRKPRTRSVEPRRCLPLCLGGVRRLPLQHPAWRQRRRRHLHVLRRPVLLLPVRQLGLSAVVCLLQHALVLQRRTRAVVSDGEVEDRAVVHQRLAVLRQIQQSARSRRTDPVEAQWQLVDRRQPVRLRRGRSWHTHPHPLPHRRQRPVQVLPEHEVDLSAWRPPPSPETRAARAAAASAASATARTDRSRASSASWPTTVCGSIAIATPDPWRREDQQPRPLPCAVAADQWSDGGLGNTVLHRKSGRPVQGMGRFGYDRLHAEPVHHLPAGVQPPRCERPVLQRSGRRHSPGRKHRSPWLCRSTAGVPIFATARTA